MFGKIVIQEFRNTWRVPVIFSIVAIVLSLIVRLELGYLESAGYQAPRMVEIFINIFVFMYVIYMIAASAIVVFSMPVRFYKESFGDQGYLYHSLPVSKSAFFGAHVLVSSLWIFIYGLVIYGAISIVFSSWDLFTGSIGLLWNLLSRELRAAWAEDSVLLTLFIILLVVYIVMSVIETVIMANCAVCLGQVFRRHRAAGAVLMYFALSFVIGIINQALGGSLMMNFLFESRTPLMALRTLALMLAVSVAAQLTESIVMWVISVRRMSRHLNLE